MSIDSTISDTIKEAVTKLPPNYRLVILLRDMEGFSTSETADILGISKFNVKVRLHRARLFLREELKEYHEWGVTWNDAPTTRKMTPPHSAWNTRSFSVTNAWNAKTPNSIADSGHHAPSGFVKRRWKISEPHCMFRAYPDLFFRDSYAIKFTSSYF